MHHEGGILKVTRLSELHGKEHNTSPKIITVWCIIYITPSQGTGDVIITSLLRQNDVATSFWRFNDVIIASCARWDIELWYDSVMLYMHICCDCKVWHMCIVHCNLTHYLNDFWHINTAGTWSNYNVIIASKRDLSNPRRRFDVMITLLLRYVSNGVQHGIHWGSLISQIRYRFYFYDYNGSAHDQIMACSLVYRTFTYCCLCCYCQCNFPSDTWRNDTLLNQNDVAMSFYIIMTLILRHASTGSCVTSWSVIAVRTWWRHGMETLPVW